MTVPQGYFFTDQHEWIKVDGNIGTVGISDHAQQQLGDITFIGLPSAGKNVTKGNEACSIESCKAASGIYAPVSGKVTEVNHELDAHPEAVNSDPYAAGWIFKLEIKDPVEVEKLMDAAKYEEFLGSAH